VRQQARHIAKTAAVCGTVAVLLILVRLAHADTIQVHGQITSGMMASALKPLKLVHAFQVGITSLASVGYGIALVRLFIDAQ